MQPAQVAPGYPASPRGASNGYIDPKLVAGMVEAFERNGTRLGGVMTWDLGWDGQSNHEFAQASFFLMGFINSFFVCF